MAGCPLWWGLTEVGSQHHTPIPPPHATGRQQNPALALALTALGFLLFASHGATVEGYALNDLMIFFGWINGLDRHRVPSVDFPAPVGALAHILPWLGSQISGQLAGAMEWAGVLVAALAVLMLLEPIIARKTSSCMPEPAQRIASRTRSLTDPERSSDSASVPLALCLEFSPAQALPSNPLHNRSAMASVMSSGGKHRFGCSNRSCGNSLASDRNLGTVSLFHCRFHGRNRTRAMARRHNTWRD